MSNSGPRKMLPSRQHAVVGTEGAYVNAPTRWETVSSRQWGRYLSSEEEKFVRMASESARSALPGSRDALEIGCEGGRWSRLLTDLGWAMTCTDVDVDALDVCKRRLPDARCVLVDADATTLPCDDASLSLVVCIEVAEVLASDWFVGEVVRVLRPGGCLLTLEWNRRSARGQFVAISSNLGWREPDRFYRRPYSVFRDGLVDAGFDIVAEHGLCWFPLRRDSNSRFAPIAAGLERRLRLDRWISASPWVLVLARLRANASTGRV